MTNEIESLVNYDRTETPWLILHVPHASRLIPDSYRAQYLISQEELELDQDRLVDHYTDQIFLSEDPRTVQLRFPVSRFLVDPERFSNDEEEPMSKVGQGVLYTQTTSGTPLRHHAGRDVRNELLQSYYWPHHNKLNELAQAALEKHGKAIILDGHSFPDSPLPVDQDQGLDRPDICIGTDTFHTPSHLIDAIEKNVSDQGLSVSINKPYSGTMVPGKFYRKDKRVGSIMIEINRRLYLMDEPENIQKNPTGFSKIRKVVDGIMFLVLDSYR